MIWLREFTRQLFVVFPRAVADAFAAQPAALAAAAMIGSTFAILIVIAEVTA